MTTNSDDESRAESTKNWIRRYSEEEQASALIIIGAALIIIPEPLTSIVGVVVAGLGVATWISDWIWG